MTPWFDTRKKASLRVWSALQFRTVKSPPSRPKIFLRFWFSENAAPARGKSSLLPNTCLQTAKRGCLSAPRSCVPLCCIRCWLAGLVPAPLRVYIYICIHGVHRLYAAELPFFVAERRRRANAAGRSDPNSKLCCQSKYSQRSATHHSFPFRFSSPPSTPPSARRWVFKRAVFHSTKDFASSTTRRRFAVYAQLPLSAAGPSGFPRFVAVRCGSRHCLARSAEGLLFAWGSNDKAQVGNCAKGEEEAAQTEGKKIQTQEQGGQAGGPSPLRDRQTVVHCAPRRPGRPCAESAFFRRE